MELNRVIDHTILKPEATQKEIEKICREALEYNFATVFVNPCWVGLVAKLLKGSQTKTGSVTGFPLGVSTIKQKEKEAEENIQNGAVEIDMVMNIGRFKQKDYGYVEEEIRAMRKICLAPLNLKVIIEAGLLTNEEKKIAAKLIKNCGADFVKTSTGFGSCGARVEDVRLLRQVVGPDFGVKASGGIRDCQFALKLLEAGANRIGSSASVQIMQEFRRLQTIEVKR
jgi:deoxyribose-phosphate aldolase